MTVKAQIELSYPALSRSQQKIARYISAHHDKLLFSPLSELAGKIGTSPATIVRFCRAIGFDGYTDLQKSVQSAAVLAKPAEKAALAETSGEADAACENLAAMYRRVDESQLARVCEAILSAKEILIVGYMDSFGAAAELLHRLYGMRDGVHFSRFIHDWNEMLRLMNPETLVLAVSFAPHYVYTHTCVRTAKERGSRIILFTDSPLNPFSDCADETLTFDLLRSCGEQGHAQLDVSPVFAFIQSLSRFMVAHYAQRLLPANRYDEPFLDE
jgi:DNA-binding MurR/RpiR family transcriptional regulator